MKDSVLVPLPLRFAIAWLDGQVIGVRAGANRGEHVTVGAAEDGVEIAVHTVGETASMALQPIAARLASRISSSLKSSY